MEKIIIPKSLQITMDDVGWFNGEDDREFGGSARTAMPRRHCAADYLAINELGRRLNMRINCAFVLGEWDPDNRLRSVKWLSKYGDEWNNAAYLGKEEMAAVADAVRTSDYIDVAVHGLMHNYYHPDIPYCNSDYFYPSGDGLRAIPESEIRTRFDAFFDILDYYKIDKKINSFIPPTFNYIFGEITHILSDYGIKYVSTPFKDALFVYPEGEEIPRSVGVEHGKIITLNRNNNDIPWYELSTNLDNAPVMTGIFGCHWPNALHFNPERHDEIISGWVSYFERCANTFGVILSRDIAFAAAQSLFEEYSAVSYEGGKMTVDISGVPRLDGVNKFYISSKGKIGSHTGCTIKELERRDGFINYEVAPEANLLSFE